MTKPLLPPATIGIVGGGQLGRMLAQSAKQMGYTVGVLDPTPQAPAGQVADFQIQAEYEDVDALMQLAKRSDVLTYEFENVDLEALTQAKQYAALPQGTELLRITRQRITEKNVLKRSRYSHGKLCCSTRCPKLEPSNCKSGISRHFENDNRRL